MQLSLALTFVLLTSAAAEAVCEDETCAAAASQKASSLIQIRKGGGAGGQEDTQNKTTKTCSYQLIGNQDGSKKCDHLEKLGDYTSGAFATLDEKGYQETAALCCHHEMSLFVRREIARQGFDVCDLSDLHGFVHWYDCSSNAARTDERRAGDDKKTFGEMQAEIAGAMTSACPWLGHLPNCPIKGENCRQFPACNPAGYPADSETGGFATLDEAGYQAVAKRCCHTEMEPFVRRQIRQMGFAICDEGAFQGFLHWFDCSGNHPDSWVHDPIWHANDFSNYNDAQTFEKLKEGLIMGRSGLPPLCPWLGDIGGACPPQGHNCPIVEVPEPAAHRRRTACR